MKRNIVIKLVINTIVWVGCFVLLGCIGNDSGRAAKLELNVESIRFCEASSVYNNLQLRNSGKGALTIRGIWMRGDEQCAFSCDYAVPGNSGRLTSCPNEGDGSASVILEGGSTMLVRIGYAASNSGVVETGAVVIESNAGNLTEEGEKYALTTVPLCGGAGVGDGGDIGADGGVFDGGVSDPVCAYCDEVPDKGAPACSSRK